MLVFESVTQVSVKKKVYLNQDPAYEGKANFALVENKMKENVQE